MIINDPEIDHEYLPIDGLASFTEASARLVLGQSSPAILDNRVIQRTFPYFIYALLHFTFFSIVQFKQSRELDLYVLEAHLLPALLLNQPFTFLIPRGDLIAPSSVIVDSKSRNIHITSVKEIVLILKAGSVLLT